MDDSEVKLKCLELALSGDQRATMTRAQEFYDWITQKPSARKKPAAKPTKPDDDL